MNAHFFGYVLKCIAFALVVWLLSRILHQVARADSAHLEFWTAMISFASTLIPTFVQFRKGPSA